MNSPQLSRTDSPLAKIFLSEYISRLAQETVRYRALSYKKLAQQTSIPSPALRGSDKGPTRVEPGTMEHAGSVAGLDNDV